MKKDMSNRADKQRTRENVKSMFDDIAPTYDRLNHILSLSIDRLWRRRVVRIVRRAAAKHILDMATGTGDLAIDMARHIDDATILGADLSPEMLEVARQKVARLGLTERISLTECDAEHINLPDESVDAVTVAFGVRNFENREACLRELARVIRPGGTLVVLEFSNPRNAFIGWLYRIYSHKILPAIGGAISHNRNAYQYLPESVDTFPSPEEFMAMLCNAGLTAPKAHSQSFGIAQIYTAQKP